MFEASRAPQAGAAGGEWITAEVSSIETIQIFVPGRGPGLKDVAIDTAGVLTGLVLLLIGHTFIKKKTHYNHLEDTQ